MIALYSSNLVCSAEQECLLLEGDVDVPYHLDQNPGFRIQDEGTCDETLTFEQCEKARLALDWRAADVETTNNASFPTGCYRQQNESYRFRHSESSYVWYFNEATEGQSHPKSEPVCNGKAQRDCLFANSRSYLIILHMYVAALVYNLFEILVESGEGCSNDQSSQDVSNSLSMTEDDCKHAKATLDRNNSVAVDVINDQGKVKGCFREESEQSYTWFFNQQGADSDTNVDLICKGEIKLKRTCKTHFGRSCNSYILHVLVHHTY